MATLFFRVPWSHVWYWYAFFDANLASATHHDAITAMIPLWSLAVEEQFYFVWPWVVLLTPKSTLKKIALGVVFTAPILRLVCTPLFSTQWPIYSLTPFRADPLALGALIAILAREDTNWVGRNHHRSVWLGSAAAIIFVSLSALHSFRWSANSVVFNTLGYSLLEVIFGAALVYLLGSQRGFIYAAFNAKSLRHLGLISYTFYLYHWAVLMLIGQSVASRLLAVPLSFLVTGALAAFSWRYFEMPILSLSYRWSDYVLRQPMTETTIALRARADDPSREREISRLL